MSSTNNNGDGFRRIEPYLYPEQDDVYDKHPDVLLKDVRKKTTVTFTEYKPSYNDAYDDDDDTAYVEIDENPIDERQLKKIEILPTLKLSDYDNKTSSPIVPKKKTHVRKSTPGHKFLYSQAHTASRFKFQKVQRPPKSKERLERERRREQMTKDNNKIVEETILKKEASIPSTSAQTPTTTTDQMKNKIEIDYPPTITTTTGGKRSGNTAVHSKSKEIPEKGSGMNSYLEHQRVSIQRKDQDKTVKKSQQDQGSCLRRTKAISTPPQEPSEYQRNREQIYAEEQDFNRQLRVRQSNTEYENHVQRTQIRTIMMQALAQCIGTGGGEEESIRIHKREVLARLLTPHSTAMISQLFGAFPGMRSAPPTMPQEGGLFRH